MSLCTSPTRIMLAQELASALGVPKYTIRAVLTLTPGALPTLELTTLVTDEDARFIVQADPEAQVGSQADRIATVMKKFKLVPIDD
jgi:hypothetical protein